MTSKRMMLFLTSSAMALSGCTTQLSTMPDRVRTFAAATSKAAAEPPSYINPASALPGIPYALPMLQYDIEVQRRLSICDAEIKITPKDGKPADAFKTGVWQANTAIALGATATPAMVAGERYLIDYRKLGSALKTTQFTIDYQPDSELLKSINASADDHSAEVIGAVVKTGLTVAGLVAGPAGAATVATALAAETVTKSSSSMANGFKVKTNNGSFDFNDLFKTHNAPNLQIVSVQEELLALLHQPLISPSTKYVACNESARALVAAYNQATANLKMLQVGPRDEKDDKGKALNKPALDVLNARIQALVPLALARALSRKQVAELTQLLEEQRATLALIAGAQKAVAAAAGPLSASTADRWPTHFDDHGATVIAALGAENSEWAGLLTVETRPVLDRTAFASELARDPERLARIKTIFSPFVEEFLDGNDKPKTFPSVDIIGCKGVAASVKTCLDNSLKVRAQFLPNPSDDLQQCAANKDSKSDDGTSRTTDLGITDECLATPEKWNSGRKPTQTVSGDDGSPDGELKPIAARSINPKGGIFVRPPARAILSICLAPAKVEEPGCAAGSENLVKPEVVLVPQLGQLRYLPLVNNAFENNALIVNLSVTGRIEKFSYTTSKAAALVLANAASDAATQVAAFKKQRADEATANDKANDPVAALQKQIDLAEKQKALDKLLAPKATPTDADAMAADTKARQIVIDNLTAQKLQIEGQKAINELCPTPDQGKKPASYCPQS